MGPISRSVLTPGLTAQHVVTQALGVTMRALGRRALDESISLTEINDAPSLASAAGLVPQPQPLTAPISMPRRM